MRYVTLFIVSALTLLVSCQQQDEGKSTVVFPAIETGPVAGNADDCAIWVSPVDSSRSTIIGNDKTEEGALYVWDLLSGAEVFRTPVLNQPVNPDIRQNVRIHDCIEDIIGCGIRGTNEIKIFRVDPQSRSLEDITVDEGIESGFDADLYGFTFYERAADGQLFAFVSKQQAGADIHQLEFYVTEECRVGGKVIRAFGGDDQKSYVEGMAADDQLGFLYCADEQGGVLKYAADPEREENALLSRFAVDDGIEGDREGIDIYYAGEREGFIVLSSQGNSTIKTYRRLTNQFVATIVTEGAQHTDGIACTSRPIGTLFPNGVLVCHNEYNNNFVVYNWDDLGLSR